MDGIEKILNQLLNEVVPILVGRLKANEKSTGERFQSVNDGLLSLAEAVQKLTERVNALEAKPVTPGRKARKPRKAPDEQPSHDVTEACDGEPDPDTVVHVNYALWMTRGSVDGVRQLLTGKPDVERNFCLYLRMTEDEYRTIAQRATVAVPAQYEGMFPREEIRQS